MGLVTPDYGLLFWMLLSFSIILYILGKFAWKPIMHALKNREDSITLSLKQAEQARTELVKLQEENKALAEKARLEREKEFQETKALRDKLIVEAKEQARLETQKMLDKAREQILREKEAAKKELYSTVVSMSIEISEKVLRKQLTEKERQVEYINELLNEMSRN
jgi:F-type H+-transporting ATPase subunit b